MPSTYAHYRFGQDVRKTLSSLEQKTIDTYPDLYMIGLHGPDILFYYHALSSNPVKTEGSRIHDRPGKIFFEHVRSTIEASHNRRASLSYAYGLLCHFALDVSCHAYVDQYAADSGVNHIEIEGELDRSLMLLDHIEPTTHIQTSHIAATMDNAKIIAPFYPGISPDQIHTALKSMILQNKLLLAKGNIKRNLIYTVLRLTGNYEELHGMVINPHGNPRCKDSNSELLNLYHIAIDRAKSFIPSLDGYLNGTKELAPIFSYTFGGILPESEANA